MRAIIENMISLDHVSCHTPGFGNFQGGERIENFVFFLEILNILEFF